MVPNVYFLKSYLNNKSTNDALLDSDSAAANLTDNLTANSTKITQLTRPRKLDEANSTKLT